MEMRIGEGEVLTLDDAVGFRIHAREGTVWVTEEDDLQDYIVAAGEFLTIAREGRTVVQALAPSWISIRETAVPANDPAQTAA